MIVTLQPSCRFIPVIRPLIIRRSIVAMASSTLTVISIHHIEREPALRGHGSDLLDIRSRPSRVLSGPIGVDRCHLSTGSR